MLLLLLLFSPEGTLRTFCIIFIHIRMSQSGPLILTSHHCVPDPAVVAAAAASASLPATKVIIYGIVSLSLSRVCVLGE